MSRQVLERCGSGRAPRTYPRPSAYRPGYAASTGSRLAGFTLIELMIAVAIVAILAMIAYPSYEAYFVRANRSATQSLMVTIANREVQYVLDARAYTATLGTAGLNVPVQDGWACTTTCSSTRYAVSAALDAGPPIAFTITATPAGRQSADGVMTLTSAGVRSRIVGGVEKGW